MIIRWTPDRVRLGDLRPWQRNPRQISKAAAQRLLKSWQELGQVETIAVDADNTVVNGHQRLAVLLAAYGPDYVVDVRRADRALTDDEREQITLALHGGTTGAWDWDALANWQPELLTDWGFDEEMLRDMRRDIAALDNLIASLADAPDVPMLDSIGGLSGQNYGQVSSASTVPVNILGIGGLVPRDVMERVRDRLIEMGADESMDNGDVLTLMFREWLGDE